MIDNIDISVSIKSFRPHDGIRRGRIELICEGKDCNDQFINAIGRIAVKRIPVYAFAKELIKIERINPETGYHDSIPFNHDMMRNRLKNTPVMNIDTGFAFLHERYWKNVDYLNPAREKHEAEKRIEVYIDAKNNESEENPDVILNVTTNDMKLYIDDVLTNVYDKEYPLLLISLKPKEAFKCSMKAVLGIGINDTCWDACSNFCYDQETLPGKTIVKIESASRFNEFILIERSLEYFRLRTKMLKDEINRMFLLETNSTNRFQITIKDEDHTMGEPINYEIQSHPDIMKSSNSKPDHLVRQIVIDVVAFEKEKLLNAIMQSMDNLIAKIDHFDDQFKLINRPENIDKNPTNVKNQSTFKNPTSDQNNKIPSVKTTNKQSNTNSDKTSKKNSTNKNKKK